MAGGTVTSPSHRVATDDSRLDELDRLLPVDEALARVLDAVRPLPPVERPLLETLGAVIAETIVAPASLPPFTNSAMDGYALRSRDTAGAAPGRPVSLTVVGTVAAGDEPRVELMAGQSMRIMTGAPLPPGADAVVRFEEIDESDASTVRVHRPIRAHEQVRFAGEDVRPGDPVVVAGTVVNPAVIGLLAALGVPAARVHRQPRVAILSTGNEIVPVDSEAGPGRVHDSNSAMLAALVTRAGGLPCALGVTRDTMDDLRGALRRAVAEVAPDLIVTSGGVSVGNYDLVKQALQAEGRIALWQVRMKPGKPLAFGEVGGVPLLGLPGNPAAAAISFLQFGWPAIRRLLGHIAVALPTVGACVTEEIANPGGRRHYVRARLGQADDGRIVATPVPQAGAGILSSLATADGLLVVPEDQTHVPAGSCLTAQVLRGGW